MKTVLVVGASGTLGAAIVGVLLNADFFVVGTFHSTEEALDTYAEHRSFRAVKLDVRDYNACQDLCSSLSLNGEEIYAVVYAAGIVRDCAFSLMSEDAWKAVIDINLTGAFNVVRATAKNMMLAQEGRIIMIGSTSGSCGTPGQANYCAAKAGLEGFARSLAAELGPYAITANVVAAGPIDSPLTRNTTPARVDAIKRKVPLRRFGSPNDVAMMVAFLIGDSGAYITGHTVAIDGGLTAI